MGNNDNPMTNDEYVLQSGLPCPFCRDTSGVIAGDFYCDVNIAWQNCHCENCGADWVDNYRLIGYDIC